jgi:hypothetical protein
MKKHYNLYQILPEKQHLFENVADCRFKTPTTPYANTACLDLTRKLQNAGCRFTLDDKTGQTIPDSS